MTDPLFDLTGKSILITGASSGLGAHFATCLAARGASLILAARREDRLTALAAEIEAQYRREVTVMAMDVSSPGSIAALFQQLRDAGTPLAGLVNNAGIAGESLAIDTSDDDWDRVIETNLNGAFRVVREAGRLMIERAQGGSIVNTASVLSFEVEQAVASYSASKAAILSLTKSLALEWARHGIRVNALCPGYIETDINRDYFATAHGHAKIRTIPQRRLGDPEDLEGALLLLVSDAGRYMTGSHIVVDGGYMLR